MYRYVMTIAGARFNLTCTRKTAVRIVNDNKDIAEVSLTDRDTGNVYYSNLGVSNVGN